VDEIKVKAAEIDVRDFVPLLAERRVRLAVRSDAPPPLLALPEARLARLRDEVERARIKVAEWRAEQGRRGDR
jgi:hypothetical protein